MLNADSNAPDKGAARDCYEVAQTAAYLMHKSEDGASLYASARHAVTLHRISGQLHRLDERACCEDVTCPKCDGGGLVGPDPRYPRVPVNQVPCKACAGTGSTLGRKVARLIQGAESIATLYGLQVYHQSDPRGCSLYLIDPADIPSSDELAKRDVSHACSPAAAEYLKSPDAWIASNYNRGHAVVRVGR